MTICNQCGFVKGGVLCQHNEIPGYFVINERVLCFKTKYKNTFEVLVPHGNRSYIVYLLPSDTIRPATKADFVSFAIPNRTLS